MPKQRMTMLDLRCETAELNAKLEGMRVANVYDINSRTYLLKFQKPGQKYLLLVESGTRLHTTNFSRDKSNIPSGFSMKLRKHIRTRRLESIRQLGADRILDMTFGSGEGVYHLICEFYDRGNIVLTDIDYKILTVLRAHRHDSTAPVCMSVGGTYPVESAQQAGEGFTGEQLQSIIQAGADGGDIAIKQSLTSATDIGPALVEHCLRNSAILAKTKCSAVLEAAVADPAVLQKLGDQVMAAYGILQGTGSPAGGPSGFIMMKKGSIVPSEDPASPPDPDAPKPDYDDVSPIMLAQHEGLPVLSYSTFDEALDEYFSRADSEKFDTGASKDKKGALSKLEKVRLDQEKRMQGLQKAQENSASQASLIEYNAEDIDAAIDAVVELIASGMDWSEIGNVVKEQRKQGNPIAYLIHDLNLAKNKITLLLSHDLDDADEDELTRPAMKIEVDLNLSALGNAGVYYSSKKKSAHKAERTLAANSKALKAAEKKTNAVYKKVEKSQGRGVQQIRKAYWFEKFAWFVTSENYLVLCGQDAGQNELLVKRYLKPGDAYVHADLHGAGSVIVKNHTSGTAIAPQSLAQAGAFTVCRSKAWDSNIVTSAWWVDAHQVSKTAPRCDRKCHSIASAIPCGPPGHTMHVLPHAIHFFNGLIHHAHAVESI